MEKVLACVQVGEGPGWPEAEFPGGVAVKAETGIRDQSWSKAKGGYRPGGQLGIR